MDNIMGIYYFNDDFILIKNILHIITYLTKLILKLRIEIILQI